MRSFRIVDRFEVFSYQDQLCLFSPPTPNLDVSISSGRRFTAGHHVGRLVLINRLGLGGPYMPLATDGADGQRLANERCQKTLSAPY